MSIFSASRFLFIVTRNILPILNELLVLTSDSFQVSDFGLARLALDSFTHVTTRVMGTFGYDLCVFINTYYLPD